MSWATMLLVAMAAGLSGACASEDTLALGVNAACTRTKDCQQGLSCTGGVCTPPDAGTEGAADSAGLPDVIDLQ